MATSTAASRRHKGGRRAGAGSTHVGRVRGRELQTAAPQIGRRSGKAPSIPPIDAVMISVETCPYRSIGLHFERRRQSRNRANER